MNRLSLFSRAIRPSLYKMKTKRALFGYLMILPFVIGFLTFFLVPFIQSVLYSLSDVTMSRGLELDPNQFANYKKALLVDPKFLQLMTKNLSQLAYEVPLVVMFSLFAAVLLNNKFMGRNTARVVFFLPVIVTSGVMLSLEATDYLLKASQSGFETVGAAGNVFTMDTFNIEKLLLATNLNKDIIKFLTDSVNHLYEVISYSGVQITIFLAALQSIPDSLYEAAKVEGSTAWESFWKITFSMISPYIFINAFYTIIDTFIRPTNSMMQYIKQVMDTQVDYGYSSCMSLIYTGVMLLIMGAIAVIAFIMARVYNSDKGGR